MPRFLPAPQYVRAHWHRGSAVGSVGWVERSGTYRRPRGGMIRAPRDVHDGLRGAQLIPRMLRIPSLSDAKASSCSRAQGLARGTFQTPDYAGGRIVKFNLAANTCLGND